MGPPNSKAVEGAATQCTPGVCHGHSPGGAYAYLGYIQKGYSDGNPNIEPPLVNIVATMESESKKQTLLQVPT